MAINMGTNKIISHSIIINVIKPQNRWLNCGWLVCNELLHSCRKQGRAFMRRELLTEIGGLGRVLPFKKPGKSFETRNNKSKSPEPRVRLWYLRKTKRPRSLDCIKQGRKCYRQCQKHIGVIFWSPMRSDKVIGLFIFVEKPCANKSGISILCLKDCSCCLFIPSQIVSIVDNEHMQKNVKVLHF